MTEQEAIEALQDMHDVAECRIKSGDSRGVVYIPEDKLKSFNIAIAALEDIQQYRAIGTPEECQAAVEKQKAKKPIEPDEEYGTFKCPNCGGLIFTEDRFETHKYCLLCGQKLDWSDEE